jgi:hypothetical protein
MRDGYSSGTTRLSFDKIAEPRSLAHLDRHGALEVRQRKVGRAVAAKGCSQEGEQGGILADRQDLTVTKRPARGGKIEGKDLDLADKGGSHRCAMGRCQTSQYNN